MIDAILRWPPRLVATLVLCLGLLAGVVLGALAVRLVRPILEAPVFRRSNYRGAEVGVGSGLVIVVVGLVLAPTSSLACWLAFGDRPPETFRTDYWESFFLTISSVGFPVLIFSFLGLIDDLGATGTARGFRGHLATLRTGRLSTGALKLFGGGAVALALAAGSTLGADHGFGWVLVNGAIIALSANLANLFDRAPGRCLKVGLVASAALLIGMVVFMAPFMIDRSYRPTLALAVMAGVLVVMLRDDLRERTMLGDTGSNPIGAMLGISVLVTPQSVRIAVLAVLIALNLASEKVSFARVIDGVRPLRWFDRLGTLPERRSPGSS